MVTQFLKCIRCQETRIHCDAVEISGLHIQKNFNNSAACLPSLKPNSFENLILSKLIHLYLVSFVSKVKNLIFIFTLLIFWFKKICAKKVAKSRVRQLTQIFCTLTFFYFQTFTPPSHCLLRQVTNYILSHTRSAPFKIKRKTDRTKLALFSIAYQTASTSIFPNAQPPLISN